jgi:hypothetical protein
VRARKPSASASGRSSGRLGLAVLVATVAAFLLVPVTQAAAAGILKVNIEGPGSGEVVKSAGAFGGEFECSYSSPGPATGECEPEMKLNGESKEEEDIRSYPAAGSEVGSVSIDRGTDALLFGPGYECDNTAGQKEIYEFEGYWLCGIIGEGGSKGGEVTVCFVKTGEGEGPCGEETPNLVLNIEEGSGTVVSNPAGLECSGAAPTSCEKELPVGSVTLTASPAPGYLFKSWKGCATVNGRQCTVSVDGTPPPTTVGAKFVKAFELKGSKSGGLGIMSTAPGGINCGYACTSSTALYKEGALTVKAKPAKHFHFVKFQNGTGSAASCNGVTAETCTIATFSSNSALEEVYAEDAKNTLSVSKEGGGQGFIKTTPANINCGYTCTAAAAQFYFNESAAITVTLNKGTTSVTWVKGAGTCTTGSKVLTCSVPMSSSASLVAKFD